MKQGALGRQATDQTYLQVHARGPRRPSSAGAPGSGARPVARREQGIRTGWLRGAGRCGGLGSRSTPRQTGGSRCGRWRTPPRPHPPAPCQLAASPDAPACSLRAAAPQPFIVVATDVAHAGYSGSHRPLPCISCHHSCRSKSLPNPSICERQPHAYRTLDGAVHGQTQDRGKLYGARTGEWRLAGLVFPGAGVICIRMHRGHKLWHQPGLKRDVADSAIATIR